MSSLILDIKIERLVNGKPKTFTMKYNTSSKFHNDKVNFENDNYYLLLDGIVLNKTELLKNVPNKNWVEYLIEKYQVDGSHFFKELKGSYYGFLYDKRNCKWVVFTDHISSKPIYYYEGQKHIVFSNSYSDLVDYLKQKKVNITLNEQAAYLILSYGYVFEDITITNEIKRLIIGYNAIVESDKLSFEKFYSLSNKPVDISEKDAIDKIDMYFRKAVQLAFEKDKEYGYKHIAALSGGLDSRMTVWVAHDLGYTDQLNITFSQSDYLDETVPKKIAADLKHEWLFKALDNGNFLKNIGETTQITGGNVLYYGLAHGLSLYNYLDFENLGIVHSGQLAFALSGLHYSSLDVCTKGEFGDGAYSKKLLHRLNLDFKEKYKNEEILKAYIRGSYGTNQGNHGIQKFTETYSPFYDIDFMEFALSIPIKLRYNHSLYKKWILEKYPEANNYVWEKTKQKLTDKNINVKFKGRSIPIKNIPRLALRKFGLLKKPLNTKHHMNPLEYWYNTNSDIATYQDEYFENTIDLLKNKTLRKDCDNLYTEGTAIEKNQVLTLLSALKLFY